MPRTVTPQRGKAKRSAKRQPARAPRRQRRNEDMARDILSVALIAIGLLGLASLVFPAGTGSVGRVIAAELHAFVGRGGFFLPLSIITIGVYLLLDPSRVCLNEINASIATLYLACISLLHVHGVPQALTADPLARMQCGGWLGALIGGSLRGWVGSIGADIVLLSASVIALLIITDIPLPDVLRSAGQKASRGADAVRRARGMRAAGEADARPRSRKFPFADFDPSAADAAPEASAEREAPETPAMEPETLEPPVNEKRKKRGKEAAVAENIPDLPEEQEPALDTVVPEPEEPEEPVDMPQPILWNTRPAAAEPAAEIAPELEEETSAEEEKPAETTADEAPAATPKEFIAPPTSLLEYAQVLPDGPGAAADTSHNIKILEETLAQFNIQAKVVEIAQGPAFTRYEIRLAPGIRVHRIESLGDNIAMNLAALDVRIQAPIPGKAAIGIEVPNKATAMVSLREVVESPDFQNARSILTFALGKDVTGKSWCADLTRMPHLLIGGATNSGKSVCLNCLIASILFRAKPQEVKFLLIDPKRVELSLFDGIPHLIYPVITDIKKAAGMLNWAVREMERRYDMFVKVGARDVNSYNNRAAQEDLEHLPYIVIVVDELADLMMQVAAEVEQSICRLAQLARATGIHLVIATQRPSVDVITGLIKANISSRIAFAVSSHIDSRTILDKRGAERLLGRGDMLFDPIGASKPVRIQGAFLSEREVETLVEYLRRQAEPVYTAEPVDTPASGGPGKGAETDETEDELFEDAVRLVVTTRRASTSMLQRKFSIGYTRAARLIDVMEDRGIVSALDGAKPREVLVSREQIEQFFASPLAAPPAGSDDE